MRRSSISRTELISLILLVGAGLYLSGVAAYWRWLALAGYLLTVAAWWALARPRLISRQVNWRRRRRE